MSEKADYGTPELRRHGRVVIENRTIAAGGAVTGQGARNVLHCYLDYLKLTGLLGREPDATNRYDAGYAFRLLWVRTHRSGKTMSLDPSPPAQPGDNAVEAGEIGATADLLATEWHEVNRRLDAWRKGRARLLRFICLEDVTPCRGQPKFHADVRDALDALAEIMEKTHRDVWERRRT